MTKTMRGAVALVATLATAGCAQLGPVGEILGGVLGQQQGQGGNGEVYGEVRAVDTQRQVLQIQTSNGQVGNVRFDQRTRVVYQQREYPITALERGDQVGMRIQQTQQGGAYTDYITVTQSVQERTGQGGNGGYDNGGNAGLTRLEGRVGWVDVNRGEFQLRTSRGDATVYLRSNTSGYETDRFRRLREGDNVRVEGRLANGNRLELERFY